MKHTLRNNERTVRQVDLTVGRNVPVPSEGKSVDFDLLFGVYIINFPRREIPMRVRMSTSLLFIIL